MRLPLLGLGAALGCLTLATEAAAQSPYINTPGCDCAAGSVAAGQPLDQGVVIGGTGTYVGATSVSPAQGQIMPYSYWINYPAPSRVYVEYGSGDQFPFLGRPYGSPNDRWSWYNMGGGSNRYLAKYYYPILR